MRSYLSLIPISAKVRRRRNRMTLLCIIIAVFLVTAIFSLADMAIRAEKTQNIKTHGNYHIRLENISGNDIADIAAIASRADVVAASWYDVINLDMDKDYTIDGVQTALCGIENTFITDIMSYFTEGADLSSDSQIILTPNAKSLLKVDVGDSITLNTPSGGRSFIISGFRSDDARYVNSNGGETSALLVKEDQIGAFMTITAFREICSLNNENSSPMYYIRFKNNSGIISKAVTDIKEQYGLSDENIEQNAIVMAAMGLSDKAYVSNFYVIAVILFVLILTASVLMISGSLNSNIAERSQFFGMLRCLGASRSQIIRFVRLEALNWCKTAIPAGIILGILITWGVCAILRYIVSGEFSEMPVFGISAVGIICGAVVGVLTVLIAADAPAKRASKVSPVVAVSGNSENAKKVRHAAKTRFLKIESALGIHHAVSAKKNLILMTGSFALSIILFLCFSVLTELIGYLIPQKSYAADLEITSKDLTNSIDRALLDEIRLMPCIKNAAGRMNAGDIAAEFDTEGVQSTIDIISYDELQLGWLPKDKDLRKGSDVTKVYGNSNYVLTIYDKDVPLETGDKIRIGKDELEIAGMLKYNPFSNDGSTGGEVIAICSEETFMRLTGESDYTVIDIQLTDDATETDISEIRELAGEEYHFRDRRSEADGSFYWAFMLFTYGFLLIIAFISVLYIVNSISMSVSARIKQYGAMRAVGMEGRQVTKMIAAEAFTYALAGCAIGCVIGIPLNKFLYDYMITSHFNYYTWSFPFLPLIIILLFVLVSSAAAVYAPAKRIRNMAVADTINEL